MDSTELRNLLIDLGFSYDMKTGTTSHHWKGNLHVAVGQHYFEISLSYGLCTIGGDIKNLEYVEDRGDNVVFSFLNDLCAEFNIGGK